MMDAEPLTVDNQKEPHRRSPNTPVGFHTLAALGVKHYIMNIENDTWKTDGTFEALCKARGYITNDEVNLDKTFPPEKQAIFFAEHLHDDEEVRFVLDGTGYFDVRDRNDEWVRMLVTPGDVIVLPAGIYHRFTLDTAMKIKVLRLFQQDAKWVAINRPREDNSARQKYLTFLSKTAVGPQSERNGMLFDPTKYDTIVEAQTEAMKSAALFVLFTGTKDALNNESWCPDCTADYGKIGTEVGKQLDANASSRYLEVLVHRESYKGNAAYPLRLQPQIGPFLNKSGIPTLVRYDVDKDGTRSAPVVHHYLEADSKL